MTTTLTNLAPLVAGRIVEDRILTDSGLIYVNFQGRIRLQRYGHIVVDLGTMSDAPEDVAAAFVAVTRVAA